MKNKPVKSTMSVGLVPGNSTVKTQLIPPGTITNEARPADTYAKKPPAKWGQRQRRG